MSATAPRRVVRVLAPALIASALLGPATAAATGPNPDAGLVFRQGNGRVIPFEGEPRSWCGPWELGVHRRSVHVAIQGRRRGWELRAVRRDVRRGTTISFPSEFIFNRPHGAQLFVHDGRIEASTAEEESSGSMSFSRLACRPGAIIEFTIHAALGSELFGGSPIRVAGLYRGRVTGPPGALRGPVA